MHGNGDCRHAGACALLSVVRSTLIYESRLAANDAPVLTAMRELSDRYPRFGYRRIHVMLDREGHVMSVGRAWRIWRQHGLQVLRKRPRRRVAAEVFDAHRRVHSGMPGN